MPQNLEKRNGVWYATVLVPKDARDALGMVRFKKSLGTSSEREAIRLGAPYIASWWAQIKQARGNTSAVVTEAQRWKRALEKAPDEDTRETWELVLSDEVERIAEAKGDQAAKDFHDLAAGITTPSNQYFETWKTQSDLAAKTKDQMGKDVSLLIAKFPTLQAITKASVRRWVDQLTEDGKGPSSISRIMSFCRSYWRHVQRYEDSLKDITPFAGVTNPAPKGKGKRRTTNLPYLAPDVVKLWEAAGKRKVGSAKNAPFDIIGHDKPSMTYGLYSGGADMTTKKAALEKVRYPFPKGALK